MKENTTPRLVPRCHVIEQDPIPRRDTGPAARRGTGYQFFGWRPTTL
ncbi:hypothetical protein [Gimesia maris]